MIVGTMTENVANTAVIIVIAVLVPAIFMIIVAVVILVIFLCRQKIRIGTSLYFGYHHNIIINVFYRCCSTEGVSWTSTNIYY